MTPNSRGLLAPRNRRPVHETRDGFALFAFITLLAGVAFAGEVTLTCTPPTQNTDGTSLTDLDGFKFYQSNVSGGPYTMVRDEPDETNCGTTLTGLADGEYFFVATAYNDAGTESEYSVEASKIVVTQPEPPTGLVTSGNLVAYAIQMSPDVINTYPVATVPAGVPCDPIMSANGMHRINVEDVVLPEGVEAKVLVAECGAG